MSKTVAAHTALVDLRRWIATHNLDAAYITRPTSIAYLTGFHADTMERLMALAVRPDTATLIVPQLEQQNATAHAEHAEVIAWRDGDDPYALVAAALAGCMEVGVEKDHLTVLGAETLASRPGVREMVDAGPEIRRLRRTKTSEEIDKLGRAAAITDAAGEEVFSRLRPGQTEISVSLLISTAISALGGSLSFESLVQSGPNSALPHLPPTSRRLAPGDFVLLDFGAAFAGYKADTARMGVVGEPSERHREIHSLVLEAHDAALESVRAGVTAGEVDAAARRIIEKAGYGERFFHRVGHGLGLEAHEDPSLNPGSTAVLEAGMVVTIEPGVYIPGWGGVRIEDDVVVEEGGCRVLTNADRSLRVIQGD